jgi:hypothetical protein
MWRLQLRSSSRRRRAALAGWATLLAAGAALWPATGAAPWPAAPAQAASPPVNVFPIPGGRLAAPSTQITLRGVPASQLGAIVVTGSSSGAHPGRVLADSDGRGASFMPTQPFRNGETVTVTTSLNILGGTNGSYSFTIADPAGGIPLAGVRPAPRVKRDISRFVSRPDLVPTAVTVTKKATKATAPGDLFIAAQYGPVQNGPEILGPFGGLIWDQPVPHNDTATDFRVQAYRSKPVLTWWQGNVSFAGTGAGEDEIYDSSYRPVATVKAGNGLSADLHEFSITPQNTALVTAFYPVNWKASSAAGAKSTIVLDGVVQEIDIPTGLVLFQWDSLDHVPVTDSYQPAPKNPGHPYDYFHLNSIQQDSQGNLIMSARDTWAVYKVSHQTGAIAWTLGGKHSSFKMGANTSFAFQHDARLGSTNVMTLFDDGAGPPVVHKQSRGLSLRLDASHMTATLVTQEEHRPALLAAYEGSDQSLPNGDSLIGWGSQPFLTEYSSRGQVNFDARFVDANQSYRAYRSTWTGTPVTKPSVAARVSRGKPTVYASWNGATSIAKWRILGGASPGSLKPVTTAGKSAFETAVKLSRAETYVEAQALDSSGHVIGTSKPAKVS